MQQLLTTLAKDPPEGYGRVKIEQVVKADCELFTIMANEIKGSLRPSSTGTLPMDKAMKQLRVDPRATMHLLPRFMYLFMCVLQWISIYEIHFGSRGYSFEITCNFLSICMRLLRHCTCVCQKFTSLWHLTFPFRCN